MKIAILGTGLMGYPMAEKLAAAGFETFAWNRTAEKAAPLAAAGITVVPTPAAALAAADVAITMLSDATAIREVLFETTPLADFQGKAIVQMSTILPDESREFQREITARGGEYLEAPVLGSVPNVRERTLIIMAGATQQQFDRFEPVFRAFGSDIFWIGEVGQAAAVKLALNHLIAAETAAFAFSLGMVRQRGVDVEMFMAVLRRSALYAPTFDKKLQRMLTGDFSNPNFPLKWLLKDVNLMLQEARSGPLDTSVLSALREVLRQAVAGGAGESDYSALYRAIHRAAKD